MWICRDRSQQLHGVEGQLLIECAEEMESRPSIIPSATNGNSPEVGTADAGAIAPESDFFFVFFCILNTNMECNTCL